MRGWVAVVLVQVAANAAPAQPAAGIDDALAMPVQVPAMQAVAALPGTHLWFWDTGGDGTPVVLLHPATGSALIWGYQQPAFAKAGYRVIAYSRRSYFGSDAIARDAPGVASEDLHALVEHLGIRKFHAVGSAAGGGVAADYAISHPERLLSLVINSNPAGINAGDLAQRYASLRPAHFDDMPADFRELGPSYRAANPAGVRLWLDLEHKAVTASPFRQKSANEITAATLERLAVPTLLITGDADLYSPPAMIRMVASHIRNSEVVIVAGAGHSSYWEQPEAFNRAVLDFLARQAKR
jgi:pimeloyl-ACP methyl ester carboxylesterase